MILEKGILNLATEMLNAAVSTGEEKILKQQCVLVEDETISCALFMEACESITEDLEKFIPDYVATVYNTLKDAIDAGQLTLPSEQEVSLVKKQLVEKVEQKTAKTLPTDRKRSGDKTLPRFGLREGSMAYTIVVSLETGTTKEDIIELLKKNFGRTPEAAENKFFNDMKNLKKYGAVINFENGIYKMEEI